MAKCEMWSNFSPPRNVRLVKLGLYEGARNYRPGACTSLQDSPYIDCDTGGVHPHPEEPGIEYLQLQQSCAIGPPSLTSHGMYLAHRGRR